MLNVSEETKTIKILADFKDLKNTNSENIRIDKFDISGNAIKIYFIFKKSIKYLLNIEFINDKNEYEYSLFSVNKRVARIKLIKDNEIQSLINHLNSVEEFKINGNLNYYEEDVYDANLNFDVFTLIFTILVTNVVKNGLSVLACDIHDFNSQIVFNYDNKIKIILESNRFWMENMNYPEELNTILQGGKPISGISFPYETLLRSNNDESELFSIEETIIKNIQRLEDNYFGK